MIVKTSLLSILSLVFLLNCQDIPDFNNPPEIHYGEEICDQCSMIISEVRYASAYITHDGNVRIFDDIGDMLLYYDEFSEDVGVFWVHDYNDEEWIPMDKAHFIMSPNLITPMGHGIIASSDYEQAVTLANKLNGMVLTYEQLLVMTKTHNHTMHEK